MLAFCATSTAQEASEYKKIMDMMSVLRNKLNSGIVVIVGVASTHYSHPDDMHVDVDGAYRVEQAFDHKRKLWRFDISRPGAVVDRETIRMGQGSSVTAKSKIGTLRKKFAIKNDRATFWWADNSVCTISPSSDADSINHDSFDVRAFGLYGPVEMRRQHTLAYMLDHWTKLEKIATVTTRDNLKIIQFHPKCEGELKYIIEIHVDIQNGFTPIYHSGSRQNNPREQWYKEYEYRIQWESINDIYVPIQYNFKSQSHPTKYFIEKIDAKLQWSNINQLNNDSLFDYTTFDLPEHIGISETVELSSRVIRKAKPDPKYLESQSKEVFTKNDTNSNQYVGIAILIAGILIVAATVFARRYRKHQV
jgi:hypothetical protein